MTVAIIGILSMIAVPKYYEFQRIIRKNTAKSHLSSLYALEKGFHAEYMTYTTRFDAIGFGVEGKVYVNIGFGDDLAPPVGAPQGTLNCNSLCQGITPNRCSAPRANWQCMPTAYYYLDGGVRAFAQPNRFVAGAHAHLGQVDDADSPDFDAITLTINEQKVIIDHPNAQ